MADNDELVSQFLMFTGSDDTVKAISYLEMSAGDLEQAVSLFMDHTQGGAPATGVGASDQVRAPDATQTMRLMDDVGPMGGLPFLPFDPMLDERLQQSAFSAPILNARDAVNAAAAADSDEDAKDSMEDDDSNAEEKRHMARLADMFAPPEHLIYKEGGFEGARTMAKDSKRWLLVNLQRDSEFASHALNRDVWRDELVENLIREGFIFWQSVRWHNMVWKDTHSNHLVEKKMLLVFIVSPCSISQFDVATEGEVYAQRYNVHDYPHIGIIDPRTRRMMWKKEGWTQQNPMTAELFAETAMDFCSRHSFDKPPQAPRPQGAASRPTKRPMHQMSEDEQVEAAMRASLQETVGADEDVDDDDDYEMEEDGDDDVEYLGTFDDADSKPIAKEEQNIKPKEPKLLDELLGMKLEDEPTNGARIQLRMPDGKRTVRKFDPSHTVKAIYAFIAVGCICAALYTTKTKSTHLTNPSLLSQQSNDDTKGGKEFILMAGFPPKDLMEDIDSTIDNSKLSGQAITVRWK